MLSSWLIYRIASMTIGNANSHINSSKLIMTNS